MYDIIHCLKRKSGNPQITTFRNISYCTLLKQLLHIRRNNRTQPHTLGHHLQVSLRQVTIQPSHTAIPQHSREVTQTASNHVVTVQIRQILSELIHIIRLQYRKRIQVPTPQLSQPESSIYLRTAGGKINTSSVYVLILL